MLYLTWFQSKAKKKKKMTHDCTTDQNYFTYHSKNSKDMGKKTTRLKKKIDTSEYELFTPDTSFDN